MQTQSVASTTKSNREYNEWGRCWQSARLVIKKVAISNSGRSGRRISFPRLKGSAMNKLLELKARKENFFFFLRFIQISFKWYHNQQGNWKYTHTAPDWIFSWQATKGLMPTSSMKLTAKSQFTGEQYFWFTIRDTYHFLWRQMENMRLNKTGRQKSDRQSFWQQAKHQKAIFWPSPGLTKRTFNRTLWGQLDRSKFQWIQGSIDPRVNGSNSQ